MDRIKCFVIERTGTSRYTPRRYCPSSTASCVGRMGYHNALGPGLGETDDDKSQKYFCSNPPAVAKDDPRWPTKCDGCDYVFTDEDPRQVFGEPLYRHAETGEIKPQDEWGPGALYRATWHEDDDGAVRHHWTGDDGQSWVCVLPPDKHPWSIDSQCSNCTRPNEPHHCWIRKGVAPNFDVGKDGDTCSAGAGSILTPKWHGFLRNGYLEGC